MTRDELLHAFAAHRGRLVAALSRLVEPAEAEDLAQETLLRALAAVDGFRGEAALGTWLYRIATNLAYDRLRTRVRGSTDSPPSEETVAAPDPIEGKQMSRCVRELLDTLPASQRQVLVQADVLDRTAAEIARDTGISVGNAKIRLHRARQALKKEIETHCDLHYREAGVLCCAPKPDRT